MADPAPISWQRLRIARADIQRSWPSPFRLPLEKRPSDVLYDMLTDGASLLDVGAGDGRRRERVLGRFPTVRYVSVDPDPDAGADHRSLDTVEGAFDAAALFEVLEHMAPEIGLDVLNEVHDRLAPNGRVVVSVPCTHTPGRFLRDCTHVTPWAHDELGAVLQLAGFEVLSLHRTYPGPAVSRMLRRLVLGPIGHLFGLDYAHSIVAVGRRNA